MNFEEIKTAAEQGNLKAMLQLGVMYYNGDGVERHLTNAINCWKKVAQSDDKQLAIEGCRRLVNHYCSLKSFSNAKDWAMLEHELGSQDGLLFVGLELYNNYEQEKGVDLILTVAKEGNEAAKEQFVKCYQEGRSNNVDYSDEAKAYWKELLNQGYLYHILRGENQQQNQQQFPSQTTYPTNKWTAAKIKAYLTWAFITIIGLWGLWLWIAPKVIIVDDNKTHDIFYSFSDIEYVDQKGQKITITGQQAFNTYVYNASQRSVIGYSIIYTNDAAKSDVDEAETAPSYTVNPNKLAKVNETPNFYFEEPESVEVSENIFVSLFHSIVGYSTTRWILDYVPTPEDQQKYQLDMEQKFIQSHKLKDNECTDGRIIFTVPEGYESSKLYANDSIFFSYGIDKEDYEYLRIISDYGNNQELTKEEYQSAWSNWQDPSLKDATFKEINEETKQAGKVHYYTKDVQYQGDGTLNWKFFFVYDEETNKIVIVSSYFRDNCQSCSEDMVKSIRFK